MRNSEPDHLEYLVYKATSYLLSLGLAAGWVWYGAPLAFAVPCCAALFGVCVCYTLLDRDDAFEARAVRLAVVVPVAKFGFYGLLVHLATRGAVRVLGGGSPEPGAWIRVSLFGMCLLVACLVASCGWFMRRLPRSHASLDAGGGYEAPTFRV